jgi:hypothetical protein
VARSWDGNSAEEFLGAASRKVSDSIQVAQELLEMGYRSPAVVWAVRSVEIFYKEFLLAPYFYEGDWAKQCARPNKLFGSSNWVRPLPRSTRSRTNVPGVSKGKR